MTEKELKAFDEYDYPFLDDPVLVTEQNWPDDVPPLVSVSCKTYMHENFIRDAIEGFIMQKTTFRVELLIHDDASTDKTADIVREYEKKHPQLIKTTYQIENQYKKKPKTDKYVKPHPRRGKYVALCEGDDYWTDPLKLQKQVEFMEKNKDYALCYHANRQRTGDTISPIIIPRKGKDYTGDELIMTPSGIATATKLFINVPVIHKNARARYRGGDYHLNVYLGTFGHCKYLSSIKPSIRRIHSGGVWSSKDGVKKLYGLINTKINVYNYFREIGDQRRMNIALRALRDSLDHKLPGEDPKHKSFVFNRSKTVIIINGVRFFFYYRPVLLSIRNFIRRIINSEEKK